MYSVSNVRDFLVKASSEEMVKRIEERASHSWSKRTRVFIFTLPLSVTITAVYTSAIIGLVQYPLYSHPEQYASYATEIVSVVVGVAAIYSFVLQVSLKYAQREYFFFRALIIGIVYTDRALRTPALAPERRHLARALIHCSRGMRRFAPPLPVGLTRRIIRKEAARASDALKDFILPAMLGSDEDLARMKQSLARALIMTGQSDWIKVADLRPERGLDSILRSSPTWLSHEVLVPIIVGLIPLGIELAKRLAG